MKLLLILAAGVLCTLVQTTHVDLNNIRFYLYTRDHIDTPHEIFVGNLNDADYKSWQKLVIMTHSHEETGFDDWITTMKLSYLVEYVGNFVIVDWGAESFGLYGNVQDKVKEVGHQIGAMFDYLASLKQNISLTHCVGFGLGAHACGFAGKVQKSNQTLARITGLDPRKERYDYNDPANRLYVTDADFVDVIHSCDRWSFIEPMGHADFYPNSGTGDMPGCGLIEVTGICSHHRAREYFIESIRSLGFKSKLCSSWRDYKDGLCDFNEEQPMGEKVSISAFGNYYLETYGYAPFAMG